MTIYRYDEISVYAQKSGMCTVCGKRATRKNKITNTVNPFNKNADGSVCTRDEVKDAVREKAKVWEAEPIMHAGCEAQ